MVRWISCAGWARQKSTASWKDLRRTGPVFPVAKQSFAAYQDFKRFILVDDCEGVKIITIRRPQAMNALNDELTDEILGVLKQYADDPAVKGICHHGLRYGRLFSRSGYRQISRHAGRSGGLGPVCPRLRQGSGVYGSNGQTGGGRLQRPGHGRRSGSCHPLPQHRGHGKCNSAISRNYARYFAGHRRMRGAVSQMAPGRGACFMT